MAGDEYQSQLIVLLWRCILLVEETTLLYNQQTALPDSASRVDITQRPFHVVAA